MNLTTHTWRRGVALGAVIEVAAAGAAIGPATAAQGQQMYQVTDIGTLGTPFAGGQAINASGAAVGYGAVPVTANIHGLAPSLPNAEIVPLAGYAQSHAFAISDAGSVAAVSYDLGGLQPRGMLISGAMVTDLGAIAPRGMNQSGVIVGGSAMFAAGSGWADRPAWWHAGVLTMLPTLGGTSGVASGVEEGGRMVGWSWTAGNAGVRATLWSAGGGTAIDLGTLAGGSKSQAYAVNGSGLVVGWSTRGDGLPRGFVFAVNGAGMVTSRVELGVATGARAGYAFGVNGAGDVVGTSGSKAVLWRAGTVTPVDLNTVLVGSAGWELERAEAINARGQIVGTGKYQGMPRGFVLSPVTACAADFNGDGELNGDDLGDYINCYFALPACAGADFNTDGDVNPDDLGDFINAYFAGC